MNGTITTYSRKLGGGLILADNGDCHGFVYDDVINPQHDLVGQTVDFIAGEQGAVEVVVFCGAPWQACTCCDHRVKKHNVPEALLVPQHNANDISQPYATTQWSPKMEPMAAVMHALSEPDEYVFEWRDGELFIEPKAAVPVSKIPVSKVRKTESARRPIEPNTRQPAYASA